MTDIERSNAAQSFANALAPYAKVQLGVHDVSREIADVFSLMQDAETDEERAAAQQAVAQIVTHHELRLVNNVAGMLCAIKDEMESRQKLIDGLNAKQRRSQWMLDSLKGAVQNVMESAKVDKLASPAHKIRLQRNPVAVEVTDHQALPDRFLEVTMTMTLEAAKKITDVLCRATGVSADVKWRMSNSEVKRSAIKEAIDRGEQVPGARLVQGKHLRFD